MVPGGVNWAAYRRMREDPRNERFRFTYDGPAGRLEVGRPQGFTHESVSRVVYALLLAFRQAGGPRFRASGAVTLSREDFDRGMECDESFYITRFDEVPPRGTNLINLSAGQPPPDLAVEIDVTSPGVPKLPIHAALGVPEVWVWGGADASLTVRRLTDGGGYPRWRRASSCPASRCRSPRA